MSKLHAVYYVLFLKKWISPIAGPRLRDKHYNYMFWMEADTFGVRPGWLQALYQLAVVEQGAWMVGSLQQHNRKMYGHNDYYHINGNALHRFDSEAYRMFLRRARLAHPNVFDYAVMIERMQVIAQPSGSPSAQSMYSYHDHG